MKALFFGMTLALSSVAMAGAPQVDCALSARQASYSWQNSVVLCAEAVSVAPVICANTARNAGFSVHDSVLLCSGAKSDSPVSCALEARRKKISLENSVTLCGKLIPMAY